MKAIVTKEFTGRPDGEALARLVAIGETITGDLAGIAIKEGYASSDNQVAEVDTSAAVGADISKLTRAELEALAAERGLDVSQAKNKADILAALEAAPPANA